MATIPKRPCASCELASTSASSSRSDVVIDMFCYRRHGHNEGDDPGYTQPILYRKISEHPSVAVQYGEQLVARRRRQPRRSGGDAGNRQGPAT